MNRKLLMPGLALLLAGCSHLDTPPPRENVTTDTPPAAPQSGTPMQRDIAAAPRRLVVYVPGPGSDPDALVARPVSLSATSARNPARAALEALADAPHGPLPPGTRLRGVTIDARLATADFSRELVSHFHGSEQEEAQVVNSILRTLGQFDTIDRVQILVNSKPTDALSQLPLNAPLDVIRPDPASVPVQTAADGHH